jgi:alpha-N-acetylglucosamine transferase
MKNETNWWKKLYFKIEAWRLKKFEKIISYSNVILTVSEMDALYFSNQYAKNKVVNITSFHENDILTAEPGMGNYILFHGNLSVAENIEAARFLIENIANKCNHKFVIAGLNPSIKLIECASKYTNVSIVENPSDAEMNKLMHEAQIHFLYTNQTTGLKLKLINALYKGRFILLNDKMLHGVDASQQCVVANNSTDFILKINELMNQDFTIEKQKQRQFFLNQRFNNEQNIEKLLLLIYS